MQVQAHIPSHFFDQQTQKNRVVKIPRHRRRHPFPKTYCTVRPKTQVPRRNSSLTKLSLPTSFFPPCITPRRGESTNNTTRLLLYNIRVSVGPFTRNAGLGSVFLPMLVRQLEFSLLSVLMSVVIGLRAEWSCCSGTSGSREATKR
jgi:hypothetical protein